MLMRTVSVMYCRLPDVLDTGSTRVESGPTELPVNEFTVSLWLV